MQIIKNINEPIVKKRGLPIRIDEDGGESI